MRAALIMTAGVILFIYVRATNTDVPIFSFMWWVWIIMTVVISQASGWLWCLAWIKYRRKKK